MSRLRRGRSAVKPADGEEAPGRSAAADLKELRAAEAAEAAAAAEKEAEEAAAEEDAAEPAAGRKKRKGRASVTGKKRGGKRARASGGDADSTAGSKGAAAAAAASASGPWSCGACTYSNQSSALACGVCGSTRPVVSSVSSGWACSHCSYANEPDQLKCSICSSAREDDEFLDLTRSTSPGPAGSNGVIRRSDAAPPKLQDNLVFLAGLEESVGEVAGLSDFFKSRLAAGMRRAWSALSTKLGEGSDAAAMFSTGDVQAMQKTLVRQHVARSMQLANTLQLVLRCAELEADQLAVATCMHCHAHGTDAVPLLHITSSCLHTLCVADANRFVMSRVAESSCYRMTCPFQSPSGSPCTNEVDQAGFLRKCLSKKEFEAYSEECFKLSTSDTSKYQRCPDVRCAGLSEIVRLQLPPGELLPLPPDGIKLTDESGKVLSPAAWRHYSEFRLRCPDCSTNFCAECRVSPYHLGRTCAEHAEYTSSRHCRFCTEQLRPDCTDTSTDKTNGLPVCTGATCQEMKARSCTHRLECGHACFGVSGEEQHPLCLEEDCPAASDKVDGSDLCGVCYVEELRHFGPVVQLSSCGHVYHEACVIEKITKKWSGTRITFGFLDCAACKVRMDHPSPAIQALLQPILQLYEEVSAKALARLKIESMEKDDKLTKPSSQFYGKPKEYAMASFAYYNCFKCKKFYFGGRRDCEQNAAAEVRPEEEFVCYDCADLKAVNCKVASHSEFQLWKCRFCCKPAVWFCFGTTHFCDPSVSKHSEEVALRCSHVRVAFHPFSVPSSSVRGVVPHPFSSLLFRPVLLCSIASAACSCHIRPGEVMGRRRENTPQCAGAASCPIKGEHSPNGPDADCEFNIGCGLCQEKVSDVMAARKKEEKVNEEIEKAAAAAAGVKRRVSSR